MGITSDLYRLYFRVNLMLWMHQTVQCSYGHCHCRHPDGGACREASVCGESCSRPLKAFNLLESCAAHDSCFVLPVDMTCLLSVLVSIPGAVCQCVAASCSSLLVPAITSMSSVKLRLQISLLPMEILFFFAPPCSMSTGSLLIRTSADPA